jgi:hypothetical protein
MTKHKPIHFHLTKPQNPPPKPPKPRDADVLFFTQFLILYQLTNSQEGLSGYLGFTWWAVTPNGVGIGAPDVQLGIENLLVAQIVYPGDSSQEEGSFTAVAGSNCTVSVPPSNASVTVTADTITLNNLYVILDGTYDSLSPNETTGSITLGGSGRAGQASISVNFSEGKSAADFLASGTWSFLGIWAMSSSPL